jgi:hypothetical protein
MFYPSYPSSTLHNYYPNPPSPQNFAHISSPPLYFLPVPYQSMLLPSALQSHILTLRGSPSLFLICLVDLNIIDPWVSPTLQYRNSLLSPIQFPPLYPTHSTNNPSSSQALT